MLQCLHGPEDFPVKFLIFTRFIIPFVLFQEAIPTERAISTPPLRLVIAPDVSNHMGFGTYT